MFLEWQADGQSVETSRLIQSNNWQSKRLVKNGPRGAMLLGQKKKSFGE